MDNNSQTVWLVEPHTLAKHAILENYLKAWFPILTRQSRRVRQGSEEILFVDGFAGPGEYKGGEPGSPVIALKAALEHTVPFPVSVRFLFIEERADRFEHLQEVLSRYAHPIASSPKVILSPPQHGDCSSVLHQFLDDRENAGTRFGPAIAFLDQFGYSAVEMSLINRVLSYPQCEVFSYLDYRGMNRWISDQSKAPSFTRAWGGEEWREAIHLPGPDRRTHLIESYKQALRARGNAKYVWSFSMFDRNDSPLYWLVFSTNSLRGLEEMKRAMWNVDKTGAFKFSDSETPQQLKLLDDTFDQDWLAEELNHRLGGQEMTISRVKEYVLTQTPCYRFKRALEILETDPNPGLSVVSAPVTRRRGKFPDESIIVRFQKRLF
jgi:three-Cys-motif partner protein